MIKKYINLSLLILYCSLIYWLSAQSSLPAPMLFSHQDKVIHMGAYFVMGLIAWRFFNDYFSKAAVVSIISLGYCSLYGFLDEWHQSFVPGRDADALDWMADTAGASIAMLFIYFQQPKTPNNNENNSFF